ncbi:MAG: TolC family protein [Deltaproteobacteria bacterium]|nr:TolC family protein [Candidatus Anaeroferrophillacea bacterium]
MVLTAVLFGVFAVPPLATGFTLAELQRVALENRRVLAEQGHQMRYHEAREAEQRGTFHPRLDLVYRGSDRSAADYYYAVAPSHSVGAAIDWNLYRGGADRAERAARERELAAAGIARHGTAQELQLAVALALVDVWQRDQALMVAAQDLERREREYADARTRYRVGVIRRDELLALEVAARQARLALNSVRAAREQALNILERETGLTPITVDGLDFSGLEQPAALPAPEECCRRLAEHSSVLRLSAAEDAALNRARAAAAERLPRADLGLGWERIEDSWLPGRGDEDEEDLQVMLELRWNLYQGGQVKNRERQQEEQARAAAARRDETVEHLRLLLDNLLLDREVAAENLEVARRNVVQAAESLRIGRLSYGEGISTVAELMQQLTLHAGAEYDVVRARCDLRRAELRLRGLLEDFPPPPALPDTAPPAMKRRLPGRVKE